MADELEAQLSSMGLDLDETQLQYIQSLLHGQKEESEAKARAAETKMRIATDLDLAGKFPRAVGAARKGIDEVPDGVDIEAWLGIQETRLQALGVPAEVPATAAETPGDSMANPGWGAPLTPTMVPSPEMLTENLRNAMDVGNVEQIVDAIHKLHDAGQRHKVAEVTAAYQDAKPIFAS